MARIRTIKPEFFRHEGLQDLEIAHPGKYPMMVFEGLLGHCDSKGRFEWKPRTLKLDILPFLPFDMAGTLEILVGAAMINRYTVDGKEYGEIPTFEKHQRLSGKELTEGEKYPDPQPIEQENIGESQGKQRGSVGEIPESQEGKGREEEGRRNGKDSVTDVTGGEPPKITDPDEIIFGYGVPLLVSAGSTDKAARSFLGGLRKHHGDTAVIDRLRECIKVKALQPIEWLAKALPPPGKPAIKTPAPENFAAREYAEGLL